MKTPVYVAGSSVAEHLPRVRAFANRLKETGRVSITFAWWDAVADSRPGCDRGMSAQKRIENAGTALIAADKAAIVVALWSLWPSEGTCFELGSVLGVDGVTTVVAGPDTRRCIFASLCDVVKDAADHPGEEIDDVAFDAVMDIVDATQPKPIAGSEVGERP